MAASVLLKSIHNANFTDCKGQTFLHHFFKFVRNDTRKLTADRLTLALSVVENLFDRGASVDIFDNEGLTPFKLAVEYQQKDLLKLILIRLKRICLCYVKNCQDKYAMHTNPLHFDAAYFSSGILEICLENDVDFSLHTRTNETPVIAVCNHTSSTLSDESKKANVISLLVEKGYNVNAVDSRGYSALHCAIKKQPVYLVKKLIELGANVNQQTEEHQTPLYFALQKNTRGKIGLLIKAGVDVNAEISKNVVPLIFVMTNRYKPKIVRYLIENGADVNCRDEISGFKPIHFAALYYKSRLLNLVAEKELDVNHRTKYGLTALHMALLRGDSVIVKELIQFGADVNCREGSYGLAPLHLVFMSKENFVALLEQRDRGDDSIASAASFISQSLTNDYGMLWRDSICELLIKNGANANARDSRGMTPLHYATLRPTCFFNGIYSLLISSGANVNRQADNGVSPLCNVLIENNTKVCKHLIQFGADLSDIDPEYLKKPFKLRKRQGESLELQNT